MRQEKFYRWYVYRLIDPRTSSVFYVGKGKGNRVDAHEAETAKKVCSRKTKRIKEIWGDKHQVVKEKIAFFNDESLAYDFETEVISEIGLENLTNVLPGGRGAWSKRLAELSNRKATKSDAYLLHGLVDHLAHIVHTSDGLKNEYTVKFSGESEDLVSLRNLFAKSVVDNFGGYVGFAKHLIKDLVSFFGSDAVGEEFAKHRIEMRFA